MTKGRMAPSACAACRSQRKKCSDECLLAPHFPSDDLQRFAIVQKVYGFNNIVKMLKDIKPEQRGDAVSSLVYEAKARMEDPVNGCARAIHELQKRIADLESQFAVKQEEIMNMHFTFENLLSPLTVESVDAGHDLCATSQPTDTMFEEVDPMMLWEPL
ncbi:LOB domain-containing protein 1-like [Cryptomeria japonica]|uniref:LOB domain-containing protein 1-like n=1 Tax=Cryptomeria japonica TaxID=3369 RepID=UPI0027DA496F|nr:LOB domain-containing protein 1-like [Cryptomeria japonica]